MNFRNRENMKTKTATILFMLFLLNFSTTAQVLEQDSLALVAFYNSTGGPNWNNNTGWLTGPVSTWYGVTVEGGRVVELTLYQNDLNGIIPEEVGNLTQLRKFKLGHDQYLTGEIPEAIGNLLELKILVICNCSKLSSIHLWENNLTGPIPPEIGNLDSLITLYLHHNQLTGQIPPELGNCTKLRQLRLQNNQLTGELPTELANLNEVYYLDVSFNQLEGDIPDEMANVTSYEDLFFHDNNFTGIPPWDDNWYLNALSIDNNKMTFEDIEPHFVGYIWYDYAPQDSIGIKIDTVLIPGSSFSIYSGTGGVFTEYLWYRNAELILQSTGADTLFIENVSWADTGIYLCIAENSLATELTLKRRPVHITLDTGTNISGNNIPEPFTLCPNPASKKISIEFPFKQGVIDLWIFELEGKCVLTERKTQVSNSHITVDINRLEQGVYLVKAQTKNNIYTTKLIINKRGTNR